MQRSVPGYATDNRYLQSQKHAGYVYLAIQPLARAVRAADVVALKRKPLRGRVTFGPGGVVAKALSSGYGASAKHDYVPLDADHPVSRVINRPQGNDGHETIGDVLEYATLQGRLTGARVLWGPPSARYLDKGDWRPCQLYALPAALLVPQTTATPDYPNGWYRLQQAYPTGGVGWYQGRAASAFSTPLDGREIYRSLYKHPLYRWDGYSPMTAARFALDIAEAVDESRWAAFQHGTTPDMILTASGMDAPALDRVKEEFKQRQGGAKNHRKVMMVSTPLADGKIDIKTPFISAREMDYVGSWEQAVSCVLAVFGTPKTVAGLGDAASYATWYAARRQFQDNTVVPECSELSDFLTRVVAHPWSEEPGEICIEVNPQPVENEDAAREDANHMLDSGVVSLNEGRALKNLPPVKGGDVPLQIYLGKLQQAAAPKPESTPPKDTPTGGLPPAPENPEGEGTRPPLSKAMGGYGKVKTGTRVRGRRARRAVAKILKGL